MTKQMRFGATALVLCALAGCGSAGESAAPPPPAPTTTPAPPPTPEQVKWMGELCEALKPLATPPEPPKDLGDEFASMDLSGYFSTAATPVDTLTRAETSLKPSPLPGGDELVAGYLAIAEPLSKKISEYNYGARSVSDDVLRQQVAEVAAALKTVKPATGPDLPGLLAANPTAAQAHEQAEGCRPAATASTTPSEKPQVVTELPAARDGENLNACADGRCEVLVNAGAQLPAIRRAGLTLIRIRAIEDGVLLFGAKMGESSSMTGPFPTGRSTVLNGLEIKAVAVGEGKAVLSLAPA